MRISYNRPSYPLPPQLNYKLRKQRRMTGSAVHALTASERNVCRMGGVRERGRGFMRMGISSRMGSRRCFAS